MDEMPDSLTFGWHRNRARQPGDHGRYRVVRREQHVVAAHGERAQSSELRAWSGGADPQHGTSNKAWMMEWGVAVHCFQSGLASLLSRHRSCGICICICIGIGIGVGGGRDGDVHFGLCGVAVREGSRGDGPSSSCCCLHQSRLQAVLLWSFAVRSCLNANYYLELPEPAKVDEWWKVLRLPCQAAQAPPGYLYLQPLHMEGGAANWASTGSV